MNNVNEKKQETRRRHLPAQHGATRHGATRDLRPIQDFTDYVREYARQSPETVALTCLGVGFILGWKLKLW